MDQSNVFMGMNGFTWWVGVVENRKDPLNVGRCQIRVFGWHTEDKNLIPTADLPWALPILPINNSKTFNTPVEGDWVIGFFFDGPLGQAPVYFGVFPGIPTPSYVNNPQKGFFDPRTTLDLLNAPNTPIVSTSSDGSGTVVKNQPAERNPNPSTVGIPNTNSLAVNDLNNPPPSIAARYLNATEGIPGPESKSVSTSIAGAAQGAAAATEGTTQDLNSLVPDASSLASSIQMAPGGLSKLLGQSINLASGLAGDDPATQQKVQEAKEKLAQQDVDKQLNDALKASQEAQKKATASLNESLNSLGDKASKIAGNISNKMSSLSPGKLTTKTPVILDVGDKAAVSQSASSFEISLYKNIKDENLIYTGKDPIIWDRTNRERLRRKLSSLDAIGYPRPPEDPPKTVSSTPKADLGAVAPGTAVNTYAPNKIPNEVPLDKTGSTLDNSVENTVVLTSEFIDKIVATSYRLVNNMTTNDDLINFTNYYQTSLRSIAKKIDQVETALNEAKKDTTPVKDLEKKTDDLLGTNSELQKLYTAKRNEIKARGS
jgi:hypothetical protein